MHRGLATPLFTPAISGPTTAVAPPSPPALTTPTPDQSSILQCALRILPDSRSSTPEADLQEAVPAEEV